MRHLLQFVRGLFSRTRRELRTLGPTRIDGALADLIISGAVITLVPHNSEAKALLDTFFAAHGSKTTVAVTNPDAVRSGYGDTSQPYKSVVLTLS